MSKYNHFVKDLDTAFKAARQEYAEAWGKFQEAKEACGKGDAMSRQRAELRYQQAELDFKEAEDRIWTEFNRKSYDEAGEIPGMGYGKDGPFGASLDEPEEAFGTEIGMDEGNISGFVGAEPGGGMEVSGETGGITGMQDGGQEAEPGAGMADTGILSYDSESAQAKEHAGRHRCEGRDWRRCP